MYVKYKAKDYLQFFNLPPDYRVDGMLIAGNWNIIGDAGRAA